MTQQQRQNKATSTFFLRTALAFFSEDLRPEGITLQIIQCCWTNWKHKIKAKKKVKKGNKCRKMEKK